MGVSSTAIIPAYNEAERIGQTITAAQKYVDEVLVIDDGSQDDTAHIAARAGATVFSIPQNQGYIQAIKRGFRKAHGDIVLILDADGEFPADKIPALIDPILQGKADMVQGQRDRIPRPSERFLTWLAQFKGEVGDAGTGFRSLRRDLALMLELSGVCICGIFTLEVLARGGRVVEVPIRLQKTAKPRRIAWYHLVQIIYLIPWLLRSNKLFRTEEKK